MDRLRCGVYFESYEKDIAVVQTKFRWVLLIAFIIFLLAIPLYSSERILSFINITGIYIIAAYGLNILTGACGQVSIGHAAFMCVGAYSSAILVGKLGVPFLVSLVLSPVISGLVGIVFGLPSLRIKGFYLILATVAAQFILVNFLPYQLKNLTKADSGLEVSPPKIFNLVLNTEYSMYFLVIALLILTTFFSKNILRSKFGRAFIAIRDNDLAASVMGINVYVYKLIAFFIGCFFAGLGGTLFAHYTRHVSPDFFTFDMSILFLAIVIVGGMGSTAGTIMGAFFFRIISELTIEYTPVLSKIVPFMERSMFTSLNLALPALIIIVFIIFEPRGLYHRFEIIKIYFQTWPYSRVRAGKV